MSKLQVGCGAETVSSQTDSSKEDQQRLDILKVIERERIAREKPEYIQHREWLKDEGLCESLHEALKKAGLV